MVGNGATHWDYDVSPSFPDTAFNFNLIPQSMLNNFTSQGCVYYFNDLRPHAGGEGCDYVWEQITILTKGLNWYDLYRKVLPAAEDDDSTLTDHAGNPFVRATQDNRHGSAFVNGKEMLYKRGYTMREYTPWAHPLVQSNDVFGDAATDYLNILETRKALHIPDTMPAFEQCSDVVGENYHYQNEGSYWIYKILKQNGYKMMHYSGDTDGAVPFQGTRQWIKDLEWKQLQKWRPW